MNSDEKIRLLISLLQETSDKLYYVSRQRNKFARALRGCNHGDAGTCMCDICLEAEEILETANQED